VAAVNEFICVCIDPVYELNDPVVTNDPVSTVTPALSAYDAVTAKLEEILYNEPVCNCPGLN
jgi:hypothetical protein